MTVGIVMGSASDAPIMEGAVEALRELGVSVEVRVLSAHRTPDETIEYARTPARCPGSFRTRCWTRI